MNTKVLFCCPQSSAHLSLGWQGPRQAAELPAPPALNRSCVSQRQHQGRPRADPASFGSIVSGPGPSHAGVCPPPVCSKLCDQDSATCETGRGVCSHSPRHMDVPHCPSATRTVSLPGGGCPAASAERVWPSACASRFQKAWQSKLSLRLRKSQPLLCARRCAQGLLSVSLLCPAQRARLPFATPVPRT